MPVDIEALASRVTAKRGNLGVREASKTIGISPATLSRVENKRFPDLETFAKLCAWLGDAPGIYLGLAGTPANRKPAGVESLADLIVRVNRRALEDEEFS
jgi:transcriptional regulator with XRE-family HTH domain